MTVPLTDWAGAAEVEWDNCLPETLFFARRMILTEADENAFAGVQALWAALFD